LYIRKFEMKTDKKKDLETSKLANDTKKKYIKFSWDYPFNGKFEEGLVHREDEGSRLTLQQIADKDQVK
jgi:hypothetical protein